ARAIAAASSSTSPGAGEWGRSGTARSAWTDASSWTTAARTELVPTSTTRIATARRLPAGRSERVREPELAGVQDPVRVDRVLQRDEHVVRVAQRAADEPCAVEADAVVVAQRRTGSQCRGRARV